MISNFPVQCKAIEARLKEPTPDVPRLTKRSAVPQWAESFRVFLYKCSNAQGFATMAYVSRTVESVANSSPLLHVNQPHSDEHGSFLKEYEHCLSHADAPYGNDNEILYGYAEEATHGTIFTASIKSLERSRNVRGAWLALNNQNAGESKWRAIMKESKNYINGTKWDGNTLVSLEKHINNL